MSKRENKLQKCRASGCENPPHAKALCNAHYLRMRRSGQLDHKIKMFRERTSHPHYARWQCAKQFGIVEEWNEFTAFIGGIGDAPSPLHRLRKKVSGEPLGPNNFRWAVDRSKEETRKIQNQGAARRYYSRKLSGEAAWSRSHRNSYYQRRFGITVEEYEAILDLQAGKCAICQKKDNRRLAVDHCHQTQRVRGLLCSSCNLSIGRMGDDPEQLRRAAAYLLRGITPDRRPSRRR